MNQFDEDWGDGPGPVIIKTLLVFALCALGMWLLA